jgi:molecular chaperone GrpE
MENEEIKDNIQEENNQESTEQKAVEEVQEEKVENNSGSDEASYKAKYEEVNDKFIRLYSEFDNFKKRNARERIDLIKTAGADVLKSVLPVLDDFDRAIKANETAEDIAAVKEGFSLINHKMYHLLETKGLKKMEVIGQPLDTELHEAITQIPAPTEDLKGKVIDVIENGYYLNDVVLRYAKVVVGC